MNLRFIAVVVLLAAQALRSQNLTISLKEALERARQQGGPVQSAEIAVQLAREDRRQAIGATLPSVSLLNQFIYTEGNGTPSGVFVANDGVHVYNEQAVVHQDLFALARRGEVRVARAGEAVARAKADVAARGLKVTVIQNYYGVAAAERKVKSADLSRQEATAFVEIAQKQERAGEVAHADVIKALLEVKQRDRDAQEAALNLDKAKVALAVLLFPTLRQNFEIVDDLEAVPGLAPSTDMAATAKHNNAELLAAQATADEAKEAVDVARYAYLPTFALDFFYGIDANQFTNRTDHATQESGRSTLPNYLVPTRQNLGYQAQATLNIPVWNWGATHSRVKQARLREAQAQLDVSLTERQLNASVASSLAEAQTAFSEVSSLQQSVGLATESMRLTLLRYQAGEAATLEVVDAQNTAMQTRNAYADGLVRAHVAWATLQQLTGAF